MDSKLRAGDILKLLPDPQQTRTTYYIISEVNTEGNIRIYNNWWPSSMFELITDIFQESDV